MLKYICLCNLPRFNLSVIIFLIPLLPSNSSKYHSVILSQRTHTSLRRIQDVLKRSLRLTTKSDVVKLSGKRRLIYDILKTSYLRRLKDVQFTTSWRRLLYVVLKTSNLRRLEDVNLRRHADVWFKTSWRRLFYVVLKTSYLHRLEDVLFASSWRRPIYDVFKTPAKRRLCRNVVVTSIQRQKKCFFFLILYCLKYLENFKCSYLG